MVAANRRTLDERVLNAAVRLCYGNGVFRRMFDPTCQVRCVIVGRAADRKLAEHQFRLLFLYTSQYACKFPPETRDFLLRCRPPIMQEIEDTLMQKFSAEEVLQTIAALFSSGTVRLGLRGEGCRGCVAPIRDIEFLLDVLNAENRHNAQQQDDHKER